MKFSDSFSDVKEKKKLSFEAKITEKREWNEEEITLLEDDVKKIQRAIQEDIYKMDVVQPPEIYFCNSNDSANAEVKVFKMQIITSKNKIKVNLINY